MYNGMLCTIGCLVAGRRAAVFGNYKYLLIAGLFLVTDSSFAFEPYVSFPSARAAAMAGVFLAQADDSSAIWYNPAGLNRPGSVNSDYTMELAEKSRGGVFPGSVGLANNADYLERDSALSFFAAYSKDFPWAFNRSNLMDTGVAYVELIRLQLNVDTPQSPINANPFGLIDVGYQQISWLLGFQYNPEVSVAATLDLLWGEVDCLQFQPCVSNSPLGIGYSMGLMMLLSNAEEYRVKLGARLRSRSRPEYGSTPDSGIGTVLEDYLPARPASYAVGVNTQVPVQWGMVNLNLEVELVAWSKAASKHLPLPDYKNIGVSTEWMFALGDDSSWAVRAGFRRSRSDNHLILPDFAVLGFGLGYIFSANQAFDLSLEQRKLDDADSDESEAISLSYSMQF